MSRFALWRYSKFSAVIISVLVVMNLVEFAVDHDVDNLIIAIWVATAGFTASASQQWMERYLALLGCQRLTSHD